MQDKRIELTNATNRVLALHLFGRYDEARELAEGALAVPTTSNPSFLWRHGPEGLKLAELVEPCTHLEGLHEHLTSDMRWDSCRTSRTS